MDLCPSPPRSQLDLCYQQFDDLVTIHGDLSGQPMMAKLRNLVVEVNRTLGDDLGTKQELVVKLMDHPWFAQSEVRIVYQGILRVVRQLRAPPQKSAASAVEESRQSSSVADSTGDSLLQQEVQRTSPRTLEEKLDACYSAFQTLFATHDPEATGQSMV